MFHEDFNKWDLINGLIGTFAWLRGGKNPAESGKKDGEDKTMSVLHAFFSKVDEGMWLSLITQLKSEEKAAITRLLAHLDLFDEVDSFRLTVVNAPVATTIIEVPDPSDKTGKKKIKKMVKVGEYSDEDSRVKFLKDIAELIDKPLPWGLNAVRDMLRTHELATENKIAKHALDFWNNLTADKVAGHINVLARKVHYRRPADVNPGFWWSAFSRHPVYSGILLLCFIALAWRFYTLASIT